MTDHEKTSSDNDQRNNHENRSGLLEKIFTILSLIAILAMTAYLAKESFGTPPPAAFEVKVASPQLRDEFTAVEVYIKNTGEQAAKAVNIRGEIYIDQKKPLEAEATLDWLPGNSQRMVTLIFAGDQTTTSPKVQVLGYEEP